MNYKEKMLWLPYTQMLTTDSPLKVKRTKGCEIILEDGRILLDGIASWWTAVFGYNNPEITKSIARQLEEMPHIMLGGLTHQPAEDLAKNLQQILPGDLNHSFFSESGSISVEIALKIAAQYWINQGISSKYRFIAFKHGYHGDTQAAMSVCDPEEGMHHLFKDFLPKQIIVDLPRTKQHLQDFEKLIVANEDKVAGIIVEPLVQGAGGMKFHQPEQLQQIFNICKKYKILFIADEIFTGFWRTGTMFACQQANIVPDIICLSKALSGGTLPIAATVVREYVFNAFLSNEENKELMHGPTYMGNPLCCSAANVAVSIARMPHWQDRVKQLEQILQRELLKTQNFSNVIDVRVKGAIGVVQLKNLDIPWFKNKFVELGIWVRPFRDIIYLTPALTISDQQLIKLTNVIYHAIKEYCEEVIYAA